jgi:hypothetical protein
LALVVLRFAGGLVVVWGFGLPWALAGYWLIWGWVLFDVFFYALNSDASDGCSLGMWFRLRVSGDGWLGFGVCSDRLSALWVDGCDEPESLILAQSERWRHA